MISLIGRQDVLNRINSLIKKDGSRHFICIEAEGGIGKTRLLQQIVTDHQNQKDINVVNFFDFDEENFLSPKYIGRAIAKELGKELFNSYFSAQQEYRQMIISGASSDELTQCQQEIRKKFEGCFNKISATRRIVLSFDTTDKLEKEKGMWLEFQHVDQLQNVCVLLAGRNAHQLGDWLKQQGIHAVDNITLLPLNDEESRLYLIKKQESIGMPRLEDDLAGKLVKLSAGKPILLDLAVDWIGQNIPLEWIRQVLPDDEMGNENSRKQFEAGLLQQTKELRSPVDRLIHIMSYIYPLDKEMIEHFMSIDACSLMQDVKRYVFIKQLPGGGISLHDEVRRMMREYVYPLSDEEYLDEMKEYSKEAALYCEEKAEKLKIRCKKETDCNERANIDRQRHSLMERQVDYAFFYDATEGMNNYLSVIWKLRHDSSIRTALRIQEKRKDDLAKLTEQQRRKYEVLRARLSNDLGYTEEAEHILQDLLKKEAIDRNDEADICNALAPVYFRSGKLKKSLYYQLRSIKLLESTAKDYLPELANYAGYLYERIGQLDKAIEFYQKALTYSTGKKKQRSVLTAKILDNLSHAYCQQGFHAEAQSYLNQALSSLNDKSSIARCEITQAVIYRDQGRYEESLHCLAKAIDRLREPDDHQKLVKAFFHRGWTCWRQAMEIHDESNEEKASRKSKLKESRQHFERSLELAEQYHLKVDLPGILHQMSNVYYLLGEREKAVDMNNRAYELSREVHDISYAIDSLVGKAEFEYENGQPDRYDKIKEYAQTLREEYEEKRYDFPRFYGRMKRILAETALVDRQDYDTALNNYIAGLAQIRLHSGYGIYTIDKELERLEKRMQSLPDDIFSAWCIKMAEDWSRCRPQEKYVLLLSWCNQQLASRQ